MNRRGFFGAAVAGLGGGFLFPRKSEAAEVLKVGDPVCVHIPEIPNCYYPGYRTQTGYVNFINSNYLTVGGSYNGKERYEADSVNGPWYTMFEKKKYQVRIEKISAEEV